MRTPQVDTCGLFFRKFVSAKVVAFIDGFNLYHAIDKLHNPSFKWLDLQKLIREFVHPVNEKLDQIFYFSALASHCSPETQMRQKIYLQALKLSGVQIVLGKFKQRGRECPNCFSRYVGNEEKETDVNIALSVVDFAYQNCYDRALLVTNDSDQVPSIRKILERFPDKKVTIVIPPHSRENNELIQVATAKAKITVDHLQKCLFPEIVSDASKYVSIKRPKEYSPIAAKY